MDKTNVEDMLINMIEPKLVEIESRFSDGEGLSGEDINTLLLKAQYNHINHLDMKLNEVTANVVSLKDDFVSLKGDFVSLKGDFVGLKGDFVGMENKVDSRFTLFDQKLENMDNKVDSRFTLFDQKLESMDNKMDAKIVGLEQSIGLRMTAFEDNIGLQLSEAINKNMRWSIGFLGVMMAALMTIIKLGDIFAK